MSVYGGIVPFANSSGHIGLYQYGVQGRICSMYWDDNDAKVACRQLGYADGLAYGLSNPAVWRGPYLLSEIGCVGSESSIFNCTTGGAACRRGNSNAEDAGAFCFSDEGELCFR